MIYGRNEDVGTRYSASVDPSRRTRYSASLRPIPTALMIICAAVLLFLAAPTFAEHYLPYAWADANLSLIYPATWSAPVAAGDAAQYTLTLSGGDETITLAVLPIETEDAALRPALENQLAAINLLPLQYTVES